MNIFYFNDKTEIIETEKPKNSCTEIKKKKSLDEFENAYDRLRAEGNSIIDSIEKEYKNITADSICKFAKRLFLITTSKISISAIQQQPYINQYSTRYMPIIPF